MDTLDDFLKLNLSSMRYPVRTVHLAHHIDLDEDDDDGVRISGDIEIPDLPQLIERILQTHNQLNGISGYSRVKTLRDRTILGRLFSLLENPSEDIQAVTIAPLIGEKFGTNAMAVLEPYRFGFHLENLVLLCGLGREIDLVEMKSAMSRCVALLEEDVMATSIELRNRARWFLTKKRKYLAGAQ